MRQGEKNNVDKLILSANITVLIAFFFVFQTSVGVPIIKWMLLASFTLYIISALLITWVLYRLPLRTKLFKQLQEKTTTKFSSRIMAYVDEYYMPNEEAIEKISDALRESHPHLDEKARHDLATKKVKKISAESTDNSHNKVLSFVLDAFLSNFGNEGKDNYRMAYKTPLKESKSKLK